ncbi:maleylacetate reductase [Georgenia daeguensis]|uniref:Maleylacetate reductase n=1 Tax=Georgenia daeguensis TaxID=908355 RepID=A0ABP8EXY9_9MICO
MSEAPAVEPTVFESWSQRVVLGTGAARTALAGEIERLSASRVLLLATEQELPLARELAASLPVVATFTGVRPHVPVEVAEAARALARSNDADLLLSVGGGSTTGTAKAVALSDRLPILAVPTTYAGSEATPVWGLTEGGRKVNGADPVVLPRAVVYDPQLTVTLPEAMTVASGLNAVAHCVDSLWAPQANAVSTALAVEGLRSLAQALPTLVSDGGDLTARRQALEGTYLAAVAFAAAGSGMHHKICHVLGGAYNLEHAAMHAVVLPHVLAFNTPSAPEEASRVVSALASAGFGGHGSAVGSLLALYDVLGAPRSLGALGLSETDVDEAARLCLEKIPPSNPRPVGVTDLRALLRRAQAGQTPTDPPAAT